MENQTHARTIRGISNAQKGDPYQRGGQNCKKDEEEKSTIEDWISQPCARLTDLLGNVKQ